MRILNGVAVPTTKLDELALKNLKFDHLEKDSENPLFLPFANSNAGTGKLLRELCRMYNKYNKGGGVIVDLDCRYDGAVYLLIEYSGVVQEEIMPVPSNLHILVAYYKGIGRYRKAANIEKKYKRFM